MNILIFKTDIKTPHKIKVLMPILNNHANIVTWSVDTEDIDNVLRVEASGDLSENDIILLIKNQGLYCEALPD